MSDVAARLEALAAMARPALAFEDVPISLCLYGFLRPEGGALVVRGSGQRREGRRWGMSATWDGEAPHHMLPFEAVRGKVPRNGLFVTGCQPFDFVYDSGDLRARLIRDRHGYKKSLRQGAELFRICRRGCAGWIMAIVERQPWDLPPGGLALFAEMLACPGRWADSLVAYGLHVGGDSEAGFALTWVDFASRTMFVAHRYLKPEHRRHTRFVDAELAGEAASLGLSELNLGDALRMPGGAWYKMDLGPKRLGHYVNVLDAEEALDHERPG